MIQSYQNNDNSWAGGRKSACHIFFAFFRLKSFRTETMSEVTAMDIEVQELIKASESLNKANMQGLKDDIVNSLQAIRSDFELTKNDDMDVMLGEIFAFLDTQK